MDSKKEQEITPVADKTVMFIKDYWGNIESISSGWAQANITNKRNLERKK